MNEQKLQEIINSMAKLNLFDAPEVQTLKDAAEVSMLFLVHEVYEHETNEQILALLNKPMTMECIEDGSLSKVLMHLVGYSG